MTVFICLLGISLLARKPGTEVIKLLSCSTYLSTKVYLFIKTKILTNKEVNCFKSDVVFIMLIYVRIPTIDQFCAQQKKSFITSGPAYYLRQY